MRISDWSSDVCSSDLIAFALLLAVVGALAALVYANLGILESAKHKTDHASRILAEIGRYGLAMSDQETGLRGYVLTEDKGFLKPLQDGETEAKAAQQRLTRLFGRHDAQSLRLDMLEQQVADWQGRSEKHTSELQSPMRNS